MNYSKLVTVLYGTDRQALVEFGMSMVEEAETAFPLAIGAALSFEQVTDSDEHRMKFELLMPHVEGYEEQFTEIHKMTKSAVDEVRGDNPSFSHLFTRTEEISAQEIVDLIAEGKQQAYDRAKTRRARKEAEGLMALLEVLGRPDVVVVEN